MKAHLKELLAEVEAYEKRCAPLTERTIQAWAVELASRLRAEAWRNGPALDLDADLDVTASLADLLLDVQRESLKQAEEICLRHKMECKWTAKTGDPYDGCAEAMADEIRALIPEEKP